MDLLSLHKTSFAKLPTQVSVSPWPTDDGHVLITPEGTEGYEHPPSDGSGVWRRKYRARSPGGLDAKAGSTALQLCNAGHVPTPGGHLLHL